MTWPQDVPIPAWRCQKCGASLSEGAAAHSCESPSLIPELPDSFSKAMARVEELREANNEKLSKRDRAEWECFMHFACENSLFKRQAS